MVSILHKLTRRALRIVLTRLARSPRGRLLLEEAIDSAQGSLGIGSGSDVRSSGERAIFEPLRKRRAATARPLCIFDVGSNEGQFVEFLTRGLTDTPYEVHCFEPSAPTFQKLRERAGAWSHVTLNACGLGRTEGEFELFSDQAGSELASLSKRRLDHFGIDFSRTEKVRIQTLDQYCETHAVERIDLLKLDVEGHELEVLQGGARTFAEKRIGMVTFEFGGSNIDSRTFFQDFFYFFQQHGLTRLFRILPSGELERIRTYRESLEQFRTTNFLVMAEEDAD